MVSESVRVNASWPPALLLSHISSPAQCLASPQQGTSAPLSRIELDSARGEKKKKIPRGRRGRGKVGFTIY